MKKPELKQQPLEDAIQAAVNTFETEWNTQINSQNHIFPQSPLGEPCLQIVDYMTWAVQRAFHRGEDRYYKFIEEKVSFLADVYDFKSYPKNFYNRKHPFDITK